MHKSLHKICASSHLLLYCPMPPAAISCTDASQLARSLRTWRSLRRIKQHHAAELLGVSQTTVSRWENQQLTPAPDDQARIRCLLAARLDGAADRELARLVNGSREPVHLVCDLTHRLLAVSQPRIDDWRISRGAVMGTPLWRYASEDIVLAEACLSTLGWFEPAPAPVAFFTRCNQSAQVQIREGWMRWVRFQLSDGSFARLVQQGALEPDPVEPTGRFVELR